MPEIEISHQDILDFADPAPTTEDPKVPTMDTDDAFEDSFVIIGKDLAEEAHEREGKKADEKKDEVNTDKTEKEEMEVSITEDRVDGMPRGSTGDDGIDFSILALPGTEHLNFDLSKHKRSLSQKGSIARRKRPTRAAIQGGDDVDRIYIDSTEPRLPRSPLASDDMTDGLSSSKVEEPHKAKQEEESPKDSTKKFSGGVKIPGLLEGLSKSKVFSKTEKSDPESGVKTQGSKVPVPTARTSAPADSTSSPPTRPKPVVLPRVLPSIIPKSTSKTLKDSQNHSTAGESGPVKPLLGSHTDVKLTTTPEKPSRDFKLTPPLGVSRVLPSKPDFHTAGTLPVQTPPKPPAKVPPPVPSKPLAPMKPVRSGLYGSASFSAADRHSSTFNRKTVVPSLAQKNEDSLLPDTTDSSKAQNSAESKTNALSFAEKSSSPYSPLTNKPTNTDVSTSSRIPLSESESTRTTGIARASSLRTNTIGYLDRLKFRPGEGSHNLERKKTESFEDAIDVLNSANKNSSEPGAVLTAGKSESGDGAKDEIVVLRKSSISGVSSVKSPSINDKSQSSIAPRRGSFTGSAYNPIGFRSTVGGVDGEASKSRGNSVSSNEEAAVNSTKSASVSETKPSVTSESLAKSTPVVETNPTVASMTLNKSSFIMETKPALITENSSKSSSLTESKHSITTVTPTKPASGADSRHAHDSFSSSDSPRTMPIPSVHLKTSADRGSTGYTATRSSILSTVSSEDKKKETADETNKNIKNQTKDLKDYNSSLKANGKVPETSEKAVTSNEKVSPWNVRLRKVEKKEKTPEPETIKNENLLSSVDWRQQMAQKRRSVASPKGLVEPEKPKQDSTPEWARASIHRRQRLIESGIIKAEGQ
ncbi:unnamed protein product [Lymnaea stagnalis]|uniref:Uncharacterized protein n=1 Tax=Lymnaea stagnalis TaxID=6523 RepID=A0AAV2HK01_LYMST